MLVKATSIVVGLLASHVSCFSPVPKSSISSTTRNTGLKSSTESTEYPFRPTEQSWYQYYGLEADFSTVGVPQETIDALVQKSIDYIALREETFPDISEEYTLEMIEQENKEWFPTHCGTYFAGRGDLNEQEYNTNVVYHMSDGIIVGAEASHAREAQWPLGPPNNMLWPLVQFWGEMVYFEWIYLDQYTGEMLAKGSCTMARRGHRGGIYYKSEQLSFFRDVYRKE